MHPWLKMIWNIIQRSNHYPTILETDSANGYCRHILMLVHILQHRELNTSLDVFFTLSSQNNLSISITRLSKLSENSKLSIAVMMGTKKFINILCFERNFLSVHMNVTHFKKKSDKCTRQVPSCVMDFTVISILPSKKQMLVKIKRCPVHEVI